MSRRSSTSACCTPLTLLLVAGCTSLPLEPVEAARHLATAEAAEQAGDHDAALASLDLITALDCPKRLRDRRDLLRAQAQLGRGDPWRAFLALEHFADDYPHSELRVQAVETIWRVATALLQRDSAFLIFWSDRSDARSVLRHLVSRHPETQRLADALRILGDMAFDDGDYDLAKDRYSEIVLDRPESDWRFYAQFRFAMSLVARLQGPDYDLDAMQLAASELALFLEQKPENPQQVADTTDALRQVREWQVARHLSIAEFYRTVGSRLGEGHHLQLATQPQFAETRLFAEASALREQFLSTAPANASVVSGGRP